jgi:hypothetical protein
MLCLLFKLEEEPVVDLPGKKKERAKKSACACSTIQI